MSEKIKILTEAELDETLKNETRPILIDFYANWCAPCKMQAPILEEYAEDIGNKILIAKMNTDECYGTCLKYNISSIPTLLLFKGGELVEKSVGLTERRDISDMIVKHL